MSEPLVTPEQVKAARRLLGWSRSDLAGYMAVSDRTIGKYENGLRASHLNRNLLRSTFESAGVIFVEENGEGPGVRLRKRHD